jgi:putative oxygen-independent coproporphyrinogen III oxidase
MSGDHLALYVHWPFCVSKCPYCDFNSHVRASIDQERWREALLSDLAHEGWLLPGRRLTSIFFGGGTPSLMDPSSVEAIIASAKTSWDCADDIEITLEANPNSVEAARFADLERAGVNRISLGLQSFDDRALRFLGRAHSSLEGFRALEAAQKTFRRVSFDLIYALPGDTEASWSTMLAQALSLGTKHLSLYQLTVEPGTRFATMAVKGELQPLSPESSAALYELTDVMTTEARMPAYEISNHARRDQESRHNLTYWRYGDYAGIGPGAHGRRQKMRTLRHKKPENYLAAVARNGHGILEEMQLSNVEASDEALVMGLRLREGVDTSAIADRLGFANIIDWDRADRLVSSGHLERDGGRLALTAAGRLLLDYILGEIAVVDPIDAAAVSQRAAEASKVAQEQPLLAHCS